MTDEKSIFMIVVPSIGPVVEGKGEYAVPPPDSTVWFQGSTYRVLESRIIKFYPEMADDTLKAKVEITGVKIG